jgi:hypothetical protein
VIEATIELQRRRRDNETNERFESARVAYGETSQFSEWRFDFNFELKLKTEKNRQKETDREQEQDAEIIDFSLFDCGVEIIQIERSKRRWSTI